MSSHGSSGSGSGGGGGTAPPACLWLHGDLELTIHEARGLPNMDLLSTFLRRLCLCPPLVPTRRRRRHERSLSDDDDGGGDGSAHHRTHAHPHHHRHHHRLHRRHHEPQPHGHLLLPTSDPYAAVVVAGPHPHGETTTVARTFVFRNSEAPRWESTFRLPLAHAATALEFHVKDADPFGSDLIGVASLPAAALLTAAAPIVSRWLHLARPDGRGPLPAGAAIRISAAFVPASASAAARQRSGGVPAYFPLRRGCDVRLYQDAHVAPGELSGAGAGAGAGRCWEDLCMAVLCAQRLVYVAGWSVHTKVRLLREAMSPEMAAVVAEHGGAAVQNMSLGELLKYKSQEGVRVLLLVWDDRTSHDNFFVRTRGVMQTRDEETKKFFKDSSVICLLSPRYHPSSKLGLVKQKMVGTPYAHHQKCVLVDTPASETTRRITAFLGGLDLAAGRYDTPSHRLFRDLGTVFHGDVHNPSFHGGDVRARGPRQPWHDLHCRLDGPAAYDVLTNFEQRWRKATRLREVFGAGGKAAAHRHRKDDALLELHRINWILSPSVSNSGAGDDADEPALHALPDGDPERWHAQVFRSVDGGSVKRFPRPWERGEMARRHLAGDKDVAVERSVHAAYVAAIRSAERFVYVESERFVGGSYAWPSYHRDGGGAGNLVPMEIALKVAGKVRAGEPFAAYVVLPLWPEGDPGSAAAQEILFWQSQTMEMMYRVVAAAAMEVEGRDGGGRRRRRHPQEYLNFYCLGNREPAAAAGGGDDEPDDGGSTSSAAASARRHRRFMVHVHSKGMVVDDEYVIIGSANVNQRSLAGSRDTEIAVGAYQPEHTGGDGGGAPPPRGKVHAFRMSLWEEHLGKEAARRPEVQRPESPRCVRLVNGIAAENWRRYAADDDDDDGGDGGGGGGHLLQGHLMRYPVHVRADGGVEPLPGHEVFPDVGGRVVGAPSSNLPDKLTM